MIPLRQRFLDDLRLRNYARRTIDTYVSSIARTDGRRSSRPSRAAARSAAAAGWSTARCQWRA